MLPGAPLFVLLLLNMPTAFELAVDAASTRILFGSCNDARLPQPLWPRILSRQPDLWIWGGDNVYADRLEPLGLLNGDGFFRKADMVYLRNIYAKQLREPGYAQLRSATPIVGTWDDHDMGINDGDKTFPGKHWSQAAFFDFMQEPPDSPLRSQEGVYSSRLFKFNGGSVLVVNLDLRYNRDPDGTPNGDFLGEAQWHWLEQTLSNSSALVHIFVSSLQLLPVVVRRPGENWRRFPSARDRFLRLLTERNLSSPIVISGDVHFAQISKARCSGGSLLEVQSSGMTHSWGTWPPHANRNKVIGKFLHAVMWLLQKIHPYRYLVQDTVSGKKLVDLGLNFGELDIDWQNEALVVRIFGDQVEPTLQYHSKLRDLDMRFNGALNQSLQPVCKPYASNDAPPWLEDLAFLCILVIVLVSLCTPVICAVKFLRMVCSRGSFTAFSFGLVLLVAVIVHFLREGSDGVRA